MSNIDKISDNLSQEYLSSYKEFMESKEYQIIDKFFRVRITKSFIWHNVLSTKLHKNFLDENWEFDLNKYESLLNYFIVHGVFTKNKMIRYDTLNIFLKDYNIERILTTDPENIAWTKFTHDLPEFIFSEKIQVEKFWVKPLVLWNNNFYINHEIKEKEIKKADEWLNLYLRDIYNDYIDIAVEDKENKDLAKLINEIINKTIEIINSVK